MNITESDIFPAAGIATRLMEAKDRFALPEIAQKSSEWISESINELKGKEAGWHDLSTFWPPRCVEAFSEDNATVFFGAGVSFPAGYPSWHALLIDYFQLDRELIEDEDLKNDPLTLAELAGQQLGNERLQQRLREVFGAEKPTTTSHHLLSELGCKVYVTTNYDCLLEKAFETAGHPTPFVATNDTHLPEAMDIIEGRKEGSVIFKIHGCVKKDMEHLILTRRDYRHHYRNNAEFFETIIDLLLQRHTLFVGFSHRDPEVSRLVDDAIHRFENTSDRRNAKWPQLYSLQFDMQAHTPEIFAARGIVALTPPTPPFDTEPKNVRSQALASGLSDLLIAKSLNFHKDSDSRLDLELGGIVEELEKPLEKGLELLDGYKSIAEDYLLAPGSNNWLPELVLKLDRLASQGIFLANEHGQIVAHSLPTELHSERTSQIVDQGVAKRPYFRIANSYRKAFVSDTTESIFNQQSTFFLCMPILRNGRFAGLLFSAAQVGQWLTPIELAKKVWEKDRGFILTDSNGVCLIPAFNEFAASEAAWKDKTEDTGANNGYSYKKLLGLSRRDHLVKHIARSVVPVQQDDDVLPLAKDSSYYTVVSEINNTRWKVAISMSLTK